MSSLLSAIVKGAPKAMGLVAGSGAGASRAARTRGLRMLSAGTLSGLSRPIRDSSASQPLPSALAPASSAPSHLQQQRRLLSIQSEDSHDATEESGAAVTAAPEDGTAEAAGDAEEGAGEQATPTAEATSPEQVFLVQVDGLPFDMPQEEVEQWFVDAGCNPAKLTMPLWPERSMRAGQNKGKAYLQLNSEAETEAVVEMSGRAMGERWINISRLAIPLEEARTVVIKGLQGFHESDITSIFEEAVGTAPIEVNVIENPNRSRGMAFVKFSAPELAREALNLDGSRVENEWVDVSLHVMKQASKEFRLVRAKEPPFGPDVPDDRVVVLKGLPFSLLEDEIRALVVNHNVDEDDIVDMKVPKYNETQFNTGLAMFHLKSEEAVQVALQLKGTEIGDRWVDVARWSDRATSAKKASHKSLMEETRATVQAALKKKHPSLPVVAISGLPFHKTKDEIIDFLETNGVPRSAMVEVELPLFMQTQNNTGICLVVLDDESAYGSMMELNGVVLDDRWLTLVDA
ncbi:unnamed protein product [Scytosiphon promiscuus]